MLSVPLRSKRRRRALAVQKFQHVIPAVPLLAAGVAGLRSGEHGLPLALALFEIATSALLLWTVAREIKAARAAHQPAHHAAHGVDWFHVFAAGVLFAEAWEHWHVTHHWRRPALLLALITLALGVLHGRIEHAAQKRRSLKIDDDGIYVGGKPFSAFRAPWSEIAAIELDARRARIVTRSGRVRVLDLLDLENADGVRVALDEARLRIAGPDQARP